MPLMKDLLEEKTDDAFVIMSKILAVKISKLLNENIDKSIEVYYDYYTSKRIYYHCYSTDYNMSGIYWHDKTIEYLSEFFKDMFFIGNLSPNSNQFTIGLDIESAETFLTYCKLISV